MKSVFSSEPISTTTPASSWPSVNGRGSDQQNAGFSDSTWPPQTREVFEEFNRALDAAADRDGSRWIELRDIFLDGFEIGDSPFRVPELHRPNFFGVARSSHLLIRRS